MSLTVFATQFSFIYLRTWNVRAVASHNIPGVLISGALVHLAWLAGIAIGVESVSIIVKEGKWEYFPVIISSLSGGLIGSLVAMKRKK